MFNTKKIKELELRIWALEHPCKFNIGQKLKGNRLVIGVEAIQGCDSFLQLSFNHWKITYFYNDTTFTRTESQLTDYILKTNKK